MAGRGRKTVEHLETLVTWAGGRTNFQKLTGISAANLSAYLSASKPISMARLHRCAEDILGVPPAFEVLVERELLPKALKDLPAAMSKRSGVYAFFSSSGTVLYFGKATNLLVEIKQTLKRTTPVRVLEGLKKTKPTFRDVATHYSAFAVCRGDAAFRHDVEALVLRVVVNDTLNRQLGHFKRVE
jgi:hypothetical protein